MKKFVSILCLLLCVILCTPALADESVTPTFATTKYFVDLLESKGLSFTSRGIRSNGEELVTIGLKNDACGYTLAVYFDEDLEHASFRAWDIIAYDASNTVNVAVACNQLALDWKYLNFYADTDNTVVASYDMIFRFDAANPDETMDIVWEAIVRIDDIIENAYETLAPYAK